MDVNHNFPDKEILTLCVAEEVNLCGINCVCSQSDVWDFKCTGYRFCVIAHQSKHQGWLVNTACICKGDEFVNFDNTPTKGLPKKPTLPFQTKWIVPLILPVIVDTPGISNKNLRQYMSGYGKDHALTDSILQEARTEAKAQSFGKSEENVKYAKGMKTYLERSGHVIKLRYTSRKKTIQNVEHLVISEELLRLKAKNDSTLYKEGRSAYWNTWKKENYNLLMNQLGYKTTEGHLTPHGKQEYKEVFDGVNYRDVGINLVDHGNDGWEFSVLRNVAGGRMTNTVTIPKVPTKGSYFGRCTCGLTQHNAIPCKHMAAVVVSSQIPALNRTTIMPFWWTCTQWQLQYGKDVLAECFASMEVVRAEFQPDERNRYCPAWSAPNKAGHPSKGKRRKFVLEQATGKRSTARLLTRFFQPCLQYLLLGQL